MPEQIDLILMGAGSGSRFGGKKQFCRLGNQTVAEKALSRFDGCGISNIFFVFPPDMEEDEARRESHLGPQVKMIKGGKERTESVRNGLGYVTSPYVLIHDCARPFVSSFVIEKVIKEMFVSGAAVPAIHPVSTMKYMDDSGELKAISRDRLYEIQTPQGYSTELIKKAYGSIKGNFTDSSSLLQEFGVRAVIIEGDSGNRKITYNIDIEEKGTSGCIK